MMRFHEVQGLGGRGSTDVHGPAPWVGWKCEQGECHPCPPRKKKPPRKVHALRRASLAGGALRNGLCQPNMHLGYTLGIQLGVLP